jgi:hypothetical protein
VPPRGSGITRAFDAITASDGVLLRRRQERLREQARRMRVVRLVEREARRLPDADAQTALTLARIVLGAKRSIPAGAVLALFDMVEDFWPDYPVASYVAASLRNHAAGGRSYSDHDDDIGVREYEHPGADPDDPVACELADRDPRGRALAYYDVPGLEEDDEL